MACGRPPNQAGTMGRIKDETRWRERLAPGAGATVPPGGLFPEPQPRRRPRRGGRWLRLFVVLLPTILAAVYFGAVADDRYVSEARFIIRTASKPASQLGGIGALLQLAGLSRSQDDAFAVRDYLTSRDALRALSGQMDLRAVYHRDDADLPTRYPSLIYPATQEGLYRYFQQRLSVVVNLDSGLATVQVEAFDAADAQRVAAAMLELGEGLVNRLNERMRRDTIHVAADEVQRAQERRVAAEVAVTAFRNKVLMLDPGNSSTMVVEVIGKLAGSEAETRAQIAEMRSNAPNSPQLKPLLEEAAALKHQIEVERDRVGSASDGLADKIAAYERLVLEQDFATRLLAQSMTALEAARTDARRQELFLERIVEPGLADEAIRPHRITLVLTVFGFNVLGAGLLWLLGTGLREHAARDQAIWTRSRTR